MDNEFLLQAIDLSRECPKSESSFAVGAVLVGSENEILATGYSLELGESWHAEEVAIQKATNHGVELAGSTIYSSLEPCSLRRSRPKSCTELIINHKIAKVVYALLEPPLFVECQATDLLKAAGIEVVHLPEYGQLVREINVHLLPPPKS